MTTWGGFGMMVCLFIMLPVVLLNRSNLSQGMLWLIGIPAIAVGNYLGWSITTEVFGFADTGPDVFDKDLAILSMAVAPVITLFISLAGMRRQREVDFRREEIHRAIARITADGVVEGPKGPYVRHRPWNGGMGSRTPRGTTGAGGHGLYGIPSP